MPWAFCTPNFSEGRRPEVVAALAAALGAVPGLRLLSVAADPRDNRAVISYAVPAEQAVAAALQAAGAAVRLIDLTAHRGAHPRMGALDVLPISPVAGLDTPATLDLARAAAAAIAGEFGIPTYLYGEGDGLRPLAQIRGAGFEELRQCVAAPGRAPDFGPPSLHPTAGATAVGARWPALQVTFTLPPGADAAAAALALAPVAGVRGARPAPGPHPAVAVTLAGWAGAPAASIGQALGATGIRAEGLVPLAPLLAAAAAGLRVEVEPGQVLERAILEA